MVAPSSKMEAIIIVDQHERNLLAKGNEVEIMFDAAPLQSVKGKIVSFAETKMTETPANLSITSGGTLDAKTDEMGRTRPISTSYQVRVEYVDLQVPLRPGYRGNAKVHLAWKSLGFRLYRYVSKTFNFEF